MRDSSFEIGDGFDDGCVFCHDAFEDGEQSSSMERRRGSLRPIESSEDLRSDERSNRIQIPSDSFCLLDASSTPRGGRDEGVLVGEDEARDELKTFLSYWTEKVVTSEGYGEDERIWTGEEGSGVGVEVVEVGGGEGVRKGGRRRVFSRSGSRDEGADQPSKLELEGVGISLDPSLGCGIDEDLHGSTDELKSDRRV